MQLKKYIPYLISRAAGELGTLKTRILEEYGLNLRSWRVLVALGEKDGQRVSDLAEISLTELSTLSRLLDAMEIQHLVEKRRARPNARSVTVHLTTAGRKILKETIREAKRYEASLLRDIEDKDLATTRVVLEKLFENASLHEWQPRKRKAD